jgi:hypothetical protein
MPIILPILLGGFALWLIGLAVWQHRMDARQAELLEEINRLHYSRVSSIEVFLPFWIAQFEADGGDGIPLRNALARVRMQRAASTAALLQLVGDRFKRMADDMRDAAERIGARADDLAHHLQQVNEAMNRMAPAAETATQALQRFVRAYRQSTTTFRPIQPNRKRR